VNDTALPDGGRDIEFRIKVSDLAAFGTRTPSFDWVAWADYSKSPDLYPDSGGLGDTRGYNTYVFNFSSRPAGDANPERGFAVSTETHSPAYAPLDLDTLQCIREHEGVSLIHRYFYMEDFVDADISPDYLQRMQSDFNTIRSAGLKVIPRFAYSASGPASPYGDATLDRILRHISQLSGSLNNNADVIAVVEAGFIGLWGEWWYSDHFTPDSDWDDRRAVLKGILDALPTSRMVQVRTPRYKQNVLDVLVPISAATAHDGSDPSRAGHHNDCFVSSVSDGGTYLDPPTEYAYLEEDSKWVAMGGETCDYNYLSDPDTGRRTCSNALQEMSKLHWSYLNLDWYKPTLRQWMEQGCFSQIENRLGYNLALVGASYDSQRLSSNSPYKPDS
jgi:hypothetical protein